MLPKIHRVRKEDFNSLKYFKKQVFSSKNITIGVYRKNSEEKSGFTVVLSSSFSKKSSERNKLRRRIRAVIFKKLPIFKKGLIVIIYPKKNLLNTKFTELNEELSDLFCKNGIIKQC